jgi:RimJ/RimL family protein N-acetyltransferase
MLTRPGSMGFVVRDRAGQVVGSSSYYDTDEAHFMTEIGATWYAQASRGTVVNPECKLLMLAHAFDCGAERVQLKCDGRNVISQRAIAKLGAVREGTLRRHRVNDPERFLRDTVMFSILREEWPGVRAGLEARGARMA